MADREPRDGARIAANPTDGQGYRRGGTKSPRRAESPGASGGRSIGQSVLIAALVAGLGVAGWFIANQQRMLTESHKSLQAATDRITQLENSLLETDQTMSATGDEVKGRFKQWESEIRKLWDVANKRNVDMIKAAETKVAAQATDLDNVEAAVKTLNATVGKHEDAFGQQAALLDQVTAMQLQLRKLDDQQRKVTDMIANVQKSVTTLQTGFERRVEENEKAIEAIDAYRLQINSKLAEINARLQASAQPPG
jgi:chromosome segregation ATPase